MKQQYIDIHRALHSIVTHVLIDGQPLKIGRAGNGCRYVDYDNIRWMEQNRAKNSPYGAKARAGEKITWGLRPGQWIYIDDKTIAKPELVTA